jgi:hypothetical protein
VALDIHNYRGSLKSLLGSITQIYSSTRIEYKNSNKTLEIETSLSTTHVVQYSQSSKVVLSRSCKENSKLN